jgi:hypothetical protein
LLEGTSVALESYRNMAASLTGLPVGDSLVNALAALDEKTRNHWHTVLNAAVADERACLGLLRNPFIDTVRPELRVELQRTLETVPPPIHKALLAWNTKATAWIRDELAKKPPSNGAGTAKPGRNGAGQVPPFGVPPSALVTLTPALPSVMLQTIALAVPSLVVHDIASLGAALEQLRLLATAHFASADERSLTIDVRFMESAAKPT